MKPKKCYIVGAITSRYGHLLWIVTAASYWPRNHDGGTTGGRKLRGRAGIMNQE